MIASSKLCTFDFSPSSSLSEDGPFDGLIIVEASHGAQTHPQRPDPWGYGYEPVSTTVSLIDKPSGDCPAHYEPSNRDRVHGSPPLCPGDGGISGGKWVVTPSHPLADRLMADRLAEYLPAQVPVARVLVPSR
jgi:hypothetical protein